MAMIQQSILLIMALLGVFAESGLEPITSVGASEETSALMASRLNEFNFQTLMKMYEKDPVTNHVLGGTNLIGLLAVTFLGSVGDTSKELRQALGFSEGFRTNRFKHEALAKLLDSLRGQGSALATAVVADQSERLRSIYRQYVQRVYHADILSADFHDPEAAKLYINSWVSNHTDGLIPDFVQQSLAPETRLVLLSAHQFESQWATPFSPEYTKKLPFNKANGDGVTIDQMLNYGSFGYIFSQEYMCHMIALPYKDSGAVMYALKPRVPRNVTLAQVLHELDWTKIESLIEGMAEESSIIRFPKMKLFTNRDMKRVLQEMGLRAMFKPGQANFALMVDGSNRTTDIELALRFGEDSDSGEVRLRDFVHNLPNPRIHVDSVMHQVVIDVNEFGTKAVAASGGFLARTAKTFYADSPFLFFIRDTNTKMVTFSGIVNDPTL